MGFYLLNISVDAADANADHLPEDLSINDQESIIEIVIEQILGFEDAIEEYDDHDPEDHNKKSNVKVDIFSQHALHSPIKEPFFKRKKNKYPDYITSLASGFKSPETTPPEI